MKILVINCGSSSIKYQLIDMKSSTVLTKGLVERIGIGSSEIKQESVGKENYTLSKDLSNHKEALDYVLKAIIDNRYGVISSMEEISAVGHRVGHGGEYFSSSVLIDDKVMDAIKECIPLAPLHNPANIMGIEACQSLMGNKPMVAVFDTAFHQTMDADSYIYPIPYKFYEKYGVRKYGFHGTSHKYVSKRAKEILKLDRSSSNFISCHLGNGSSLCGIKEGESKDTSMGFTPLAGLPMGTRSGNIDPAIIPFLMEKENMDFHEINEILNSESGVLGVSGLSSDFRDLEKAAQNGDIRAKLALEIFIRDVKKYIGAYMATIGNIQALIFTAGIGENSIFMRENICKGLESIGIKLDKESNKVRGKEAIISSKDSEIKILVIPTNEELMIAEDTMKLIEN